LKGGHKGKPSCPTPIVATSRSVVDHLVRGDAPQCGRTPLICVRQPRSLQRRNRIYRPIQLRPNPAELASCLSSPRDHGHALGTYPHRETGVAQAQSYGAITPSIRKTIGIQQHRPKSCSDRRNTHPLSQQVCHYILRKLKIKLHDRCRGGVCGAEGEVGPLKFYTAICKASSAFFTGYPVTCQITGQQMEPS
jgi:hypothetical protein